MKKFLSAVLALSILIMPVGAISSFADGILEGELRPLIRFMKEKHLGKIKVIATMFIDGTFDVGIVFLGEDGRFLENISADRDLYRHFRKKFEFLGILDKMRLYNLNTTQMVYEIDGQDCLTRIFYLGAEGQFRNIL